MQARRVKIAAKPLPSAIQPIAQSQPAASVADLQRMYDSLMQAIIALGIKVDAFTKAIIPLDTLAANVQQIVHQEVTTTPPPQALTIKASPFQELPPELLQWMGRVEGLIISLQEEVKILHLKSTPGKSVEMGVSTPYVQTPLQTPPQTPSTPANKANKRGVYKSPDTLADTPEFRQCVNEGMSKAELMKRFGVSESTIARAKRKLQQSGGIA